MERSFRLHLVILAVFLLALAACNLPAQPAGLPEFPGAASPAPTADFLMWEPSPTPPPPVSPYPPPPTPEPPTLTALPPTALPATATPAAPPIERLPAGQAVIIAEIHMLDARQGWALGDRTDQPGRVLFTQDGGLTWQDRTPPEAEAPPGALPKLAAGFFMDAGRAWVVFAAQDMSFLQSPPVVWRTADGGQTWQPSQPVPLTGLEGWFMPGAFQFINPETGWLLVHVDAGMSHDYIEIFRTRDGGTSWELILEPRTLIEDNPQSCEKTGMVFYDERSGWLSRDCHGVMDGVFIDWSLDGGETWRFMRLPAPDSNPDLFTAHICGGLTPHMFKAQSGLLGVRCNAFENFDQLTWYLYRTADGGQTWQTQAYPGGSLLFLDDRQGWALGRELFRTQDGGLTWESRKKVNWDGQFSFIDLETGWAVARNEGQIALVQTRNGASNWQVITPVIAP
jgi:photosystem II stability/assembly factor-like uncharacterized protein